MLAAGRRNKRGFLRGVQVQRQCGLEDARWSNVGTPDVGEVAFFLTTGVDMTSEGSLGVDSEGEPILVGN